jgi:Iap family predicted aminopeptidase
VLTLLSLTLALAQGATASAPAAAALVDDVRALAAAKDNDQRFEAMTALLRNRGVPFEVETFTVDKPDPRDGRTRGRNIVATLGQGADEIVLGAHFDAVRLKDGTMSQGAIDNGASSVVLAHVAASLRTVALGSRVRIVWFDMEESGLQGSRSYLTAHPASGIRAMINFDINGYGDTVLFGPPPGADSSRLVRTFLETCAAEPIDCVRFNQFPNSDDRSFGKAGVATISIGILPALEVHQLWLRLHGGANAGLAPGFAPPVLRTIHTAEDVVEKVEGAAMARVHRLAVALVQRLAAAR